ncbi:MAG: chromosome segregation protein SMC [DPANN group archaeon]|nr:chromosome segregation protein SMC [DPANN group archaeon]
MTNVEKLIIYGFKSFQKKTVLPFYKGFNAIIGPNGSGKSNITDAISFVLGRRSKALRAGRMDHLIFNGGQGRTPSDMGYVSLIFENKAREIDIDSDSFDLTRKVNRKGISTYRINGKLVGKTEVDELLRKININPDGYNIIQQGDIVATIQKTPKQRREIIDEISGIQQYNYKKDKAIDELAKAEIKLEESKLILEQKKEYHDKLKKEKESAEKLIEFENKQEYLLACVAHSKLKAVESTLENVSRDLDIKSQEYKSISNNVGLSDTGIDDLEQEIQDIRDDIYKKSINTQTRKDIEEITKKIIKRQGQIESHRRDIGRLDDIIEKFSIIKQRGGEDIKNHSVKSILSANIHGVIGAVSTQFACNGLYETAIDVAIGGHVNDIIVESENVALECVRYLKSNNLGRVRFLPLDRLRRYSMSAKSEIAVKMPGIIDYALNLIEFNRDVEPAFRDIVKDTLISETLEAAKKVRGLRIVTLDGELFDAGGAIVGGAFRKTGTSQRQISDVTDIQKYERERKKYSAEINVIKDEIGDLNRFLEEKNKGTKNENKDVEKLEKKLEELQNKLDNIKKGRKGVYEKMLVLNQEIQNQKIRKARLEAEIENLSIPYEKYKNRDDLKKGEPEEFEKELRTIQRDIRQLGPVNQRAIEEYKIMSEDFENSIKKVEKLEDEKISIMEMLEKIEENRKRVFKKTLDTVSKAFNQIYADLVDGIGELELYDLNDIESGLIIKAQPPGKKILSIDSLSGGEKTMASIAFMFALQRYKPAPFYILDEVDAALDDKNAELVGEIIKEYSHNNQFIVISHNDTLVKRSERIYGVSMQRGASQILGVELENTKTKIEETDTS